MCLRSSVPGVCVEGATAPTQAALSPTGSVPKAAPEVVDAQKSPGEPLPGPGVVAQASGAASLSAFPAVAIGALAVLFLAELL
jgi:hypothetical protein